jgi:hypothetical protein
VAKIFGTFNGYLVYFSRFGMLCHEKSGNPRDDQWQLQEGSFY